MNIKIQIPNHNIPERKYIIDVLFSEFLGIEYSVEINDVKKYIIKLQDKTIEIKDGFFGKYPEDLSYLEKENIPQIVTFSENKFTSEKNIPVLYGNEDVVINDKSISCGIDIFASSFFMLTRWEEFVISDKDKHGRTPDELQLSVRCNLHGRPIVNEYAEMLRNMFLYFDVKIENRHKYTPKITHDIDFFARYDKISKLIKATVGDIFVRKSLKKAINTLQAYFKIKKAKAKDPYDTFDYLMNLSEKSGLKSHFYFIPAMLGEEDAKYNITDDAVVKTMQRIVGKGHIVGIHGAYRSCKNKNLYCEELKRFPKAIKIEEGRQHFLRFQNPETWQMLEDCGIKKDSTIGFIQNAGFRAGTCFEYSVFNILNRKQLKLKEQPLILMEQALVKKYPDKDVFFDKFADFKEKIKKYKGNFIILWHNNNFNIPEWESYKTIYRKIVEKICD